MCLIDTKRFRFTFKRIPIYKVVEVLPNGTYVSPYQKTPLERTNKYKFGKVESHRMTGKFLFAKGFYHACTSHFSAQNVIACLRLNDAFTRNNGFYKVIKGYIPAFTRYAIGECGDIGARRMVLNI